MIPEIKYPTFIITQPSNNKILNMRRYLVKEEKILLFAKESKDINDILKAVKDVVEICCQESDFNINEIPLFDLEYIFLHLRAASVNNIETFTVKDTEDLKDYDLSINFDDIAVKFNEDAPDKNIRVDENITIVMRYPKASIYDNKDFRERLAKEGIFELVVNCIEQVYNKDEIIDMTFEELKTFTDSLDIKTFRKIEAFLLSTPSIKHSVKYTNSLGKEKTLTFNSLLDFFLYL
jgi:hypothetical protein